MSTPSEFQRLASVVRTTFPAPIAIPFFAATESPGSESSCNLLSAVLRYLTLLHLRACLDGGLEKINIGEERALFSQPAPDGRWLAHLRELLGALASREESQPDPVLLEILGRQGGLELLEAAVKLRNEAVHGGEEDAVPELRRTLHRLLGCLLPLRFHRLVVPRRIMSTSPVPAYSAVLHQGYSRPFPVLRLQTDLVLALEGVYFFRQESPRVLRLSPLFLPGGEHLTLFSHRTSGAPVFWDPATRKTLDREEARLDIETIHRRLAKEPVFLEARQLHLEGDGQIARRLAPESVIGGRYEIVAYLRSGGMADVYSARDLTTGAPVAVKMLPLELTRDTATLGRFLREINEVRKVEHPRVVRYHDHGEDAGDRYLVLELAGGWGGRGKDDANAIDLGDLTKPLQESEVLQLAESVAEGLHEIHSRGLFHRDLKPGNVLLFEDAAGRRTMKLTDFGISARGGGTQYTLTGFFVGTPEYMSPEQAEPGGAVGPESDLYSLGILLYECLTGEVPFRGVTPLATLELHRTRRPEWPLRKRSEISPGLANMAMKCLHKDPRKRYRSARELLADLKKHRDDPAGYQEIAVLRSGDELGDLVLKEEILAGADGTLFSGLQHSTGKSLCVRVFSSAISDDRTRREEALARMKRLAEAWRPGLPLIVGSGESRGTPYVVLEPARGECPGKLSPVDAARTVAALARAVEGLHARGLLHGRIDRELVRREGEAASFADFGWLEESDPSREHAERKRREARELGTLLYEIIAGRRPGPKDHDPREHERAAPADLAAICSHALHPGAGYPATGALADDLDCFLRSMPLAHARPSIRGYSLRLFVTRNRRSLIGAAAILTATFLTGFIAFRLRGPDAIPGLTVSPPRPISSFFQGSSWAPSFAPDGRRIAFLNDASGTAQVFVKDLEGGAPIQVTDGIVPAERPRWSPSGDRILFGRRAKNARSTWVVPAPPAKQPAEQILEDGYNASWSWDRERIVYEKPNEIWTADSRGGGRQLLEGIDPPRAPFADRYPAFAPDGSIVFFQPDDGPKGKYWVLAASSGKDGKARMLNDETTFGGAAAWLLPGSESVVVPLDLSGATTLWRFWVRGGPYEAVTSGSGEDGDPDVSRDGRKVIYTNARVTDALRIFDPKAGANRDLWRQRQRMVSPVFSPDGSSIAFFSDPRGHGVLSVIRADGKSPPRQLQEDPAESNIFPKWSSEGESLYYYQVLPRKSFRRIWLSGGPSKELFPDWSWDVQYNAEVNRAGTHIAHTEIDKGMVNAFRIRNLQTGSEERVDLPLCDVRWSHDGRAIVGSSIRNPVSADMRPAHAPIVVYFLDGSPVRRLAEGYHATWSSDASRVYFMRDIPEGDGGEVWSVSAAGGDEQQVARLRPLWSVTYFFDVSPRGEIAWVQREDTNRELWLIHLGGR